MTTKAQDGPAPVILWFRRDLRLADNPALNKAHATGRPVVPVYIHDEGTAVRPAGAASLWWLDKSLRALAGSLAERGATLILRRGDSETELRRLIDQTGADTVFLNRLFEPEAWTRDADIAHGLKTDGVECRGSNGSLLALPGSLLNGSGGPYKVFTPFMKALRAQAEPPAHTTGPRQLGAAPGLESDDLDAWGLHPTRPDWSKGFDWTPGEDGATAALHRFVSGGLADYSNGRDRPAEPATSRLSPHLHFGEISPWRAWIAARDAADGGKVTSGEADKFIAELIWRDFSAHLLHHFPTLPDKAFRPEYDAMPWRDDEPGFLAWTRGMTGYPIVDAGMRELWATGVMHNRVRMIVASFLIKDLLIDWRRGEAWFWDTLVDADLASNSQNWQWVAGSGADASPYFRIFNPVTQGQKFDAEARYVKRWIPELAPVPARWIHAPWNAPPEILRDCGIRLGTTYPRPIVDHARARERALAALKTVTAERQDAAAD
ncbi:cryptochrome/photolyase family protein [Brevundimonas subvibrioides]|uniref:Deoxyribodipyrimidine photo-lyase n=1 Tax=Brevundimonas subvibrioides (strain ATCC 15264 / DSM 4735 / LMG 14903 / NBRC 16000 / CB 81) TaxID=633149 RepID=D9QHX6_BRESC|nr:deoxyribodipyrimidine photo-lyase [Brevundimonas subvibrioides]ADL01234.1 Deoxyribodipyrimidine photo-lyase [Brevundimonas subvibrioides ATCC 15264]